MELSMMILMGMVLVFSFTGIVRLGKLMEKYNGVFGAFKAYLDAICLSMAALGVGKSPVIGILALIAGIALSYVLCILFTKSASPLTWFDMQCYAWGWTFRKMLSFIGIAMPVAATMAAVREAEYQRELEERRRQEKIRDEIQADAYRKRGTRGEVSSDNERWRADADSDWEKIKR